MNLSQSPLRRTATLAAGALLGLTGITLVGSPAHAHDAQLKGSAECDVATGDWVVTWKVLGHAPAGVDKFRFTNVTNTLGTPDEAGSVPEYKVAEEFGYETNKYIEAIQRVPGASGKTFSELSVSIEFDTKKDEKYPRTGKEKVVFVGDCKAPVEEPSTPVEEPSTPVEEPSAPVEEPSAPVSEEPSTPPSEEPQIPVDEIPGEPQPIFEATCDTMTIGLDNPENGFPIDLKYETSKGEVRNVTINPGEAKSEKFSATEGFSVNLTISVTAEGETFSETVTIPFEQAEDCEGGTGGGLPVTGAAAGGIAGGAAALLAVGAFLFVMARRRKVKFTA
ncbi:hypothetical protein [Actinoplanes sp. DH11]|uniref:hypothetical protein n=1 Tax=Actinoplanes sp. DH11 TaxID=2857011 RepID=UPI001E4BF708|nr:hypothetical protein [Actinoplanes sp. DH11]